MRRSILQRPFIFVAEVFQAFVHFAQELLTWWRFICQLKKIMPENEIDDPAIHCLIFIRAGREKRATE